MKPSSRKRPSRVAIALVVGAVAAGGLGWLRFRPVAVEAAPVTRASLSTEVMGTGTLEARVSSAISPRVSGLLTRVLVDQGDRVRRGQLLATLYDGDLVEQVRVSEAEVGLTQSAVDQADAQSTAATATAREARAIARRARQLVTGGFASQEDNDRSVRQRDVAEADLQRARVSRVGSKRQVGKALASLRYAKQRLLDTRIVAPFDGLIVKRLRDPGSVVVPGDAILQLIATDTLWVSAWVDETAMSGVAVGQKARVVFRSAPTVSYQGRVARIAPQVDPETREFLVDVSVSRLPRNWGVGQRAEVYLETGRRDGVLVAPSRAITDRQGRSGVFVAASGQARWRPVEVGLLARDRAEVVAGLSEGEVVIWTPAGGARSRLADGRRVRAP
jgi:HlyD family secretion protein